MQKSSKCPECGSMELHETKRAYAIYGEINALVCGVCHWASDPRIGRPPADRSKNITLRRLMADVEDEEPPAEKSVDAEPADDEAIED